MTNLPQAAQSEEKRVGAQPGGSVSHFWLLTSRCVDSKVEEALQKFLQSKEDVIDAILRTDQALTAREKEIEGEEQLKRLHDLKSL